MALRVPSPMIFIDSTSSSSSSSSSSGSVNDSGDRYVSVASSVSASKGPRTPNNRRFSHLPIPGGGHNLLVSSSSLPSTDQQQQQSNRQSDRRFSVFNCTTRQVSSDSQTRRIIMADDRNGHDVEAGDDSGLLAPANLSQRRPTEGSIRSIPFEDFHTQSQPVFSQLAGYMGGIHPTAQGTDTAAAQQKASTSAKLGTMLGVFLPCIQNIFGIMMFARLPWLTGNAGLIEMLIIGAMCCATTFLTSISISALATNGRVPGGGAYFIISRTLGPEIGGSVGFLFFVGNVAGCAMYITGGIEILLMYLAPQIAIPAFGPITEPSSLYNHSRLYGTIALIVVFAVVSIGIRFVAIAGFVTLIAVIGTILLIFIGMFITNESNSKQVCMVGSRLWRMDKVYLNDTWCCTKTMYCPGPNEGTPSPLYTHYCGTPEKNSTDGCEYFLKTTVGVEAGIPGLFSGIIKENLWPAYATGEDEIAGMHTLEKDTLAKYPSLLYGNRQAGEIVTDMATSFLVVIGIFFPSVTGILAGSNRSGDLADPGRSIPLGTIGAQVVTTVVYFVWIVFFAATMRGQVLRDKLGESMTTAAGGSLMAGNIAWPHPMVAQIGSFLATMGAALQSLTSAPRLLNAVAKDGVIPFLKPFAYVTKRGEPLYAQLLAAGVAWLGILLGTIDLIGPVVTMFFLICYAAVNSACCINSFMQTPNWRPRFRFYHWSLSAAGVILAVIIMFMSNWWQALIAIALGIGIYKYIEFKGAEKDWGDGLRGVSMSAALAAIHHLPVEDSNVKSWRPQLLVFVKTEEDVETKSLVPQPVASNLFAFARQLKAGKGLVVVGSVLEGGYLDKASLASEVRSSLLKRKDVVKLKAMPCVVVAPTADVGMATLVQSTGIGALRPNTVLVGWPRSWKANATSDLAGERVHLLPHLLRVTEAADMSTVVVRNAEAFPTNSKKDRMLGTTDLWWIVQDCGVLMMIPYLLEQHRVWARSKLRIFVVTQPGKGVDANQIRTALKDFVYDLRIQCTVDVVEMDESDISAYVYQRTLTCEDRSRLAADLKSLRAQSPTSPAATSALIAESPLTPDAGAAISSESPSKGATLSPPYSTANVQYTYSGAEAKELVVKSAASRKLAKKLHSAHSLNKAMLSKSNEADLVIVNMPAAPKNSSSDMKYMDYIDILTEGFSRVLLIRGSQRRPVVTTKFAEN